MMWFAFPHESQAIGSKSNTLALAQELVANCFQAVLHPGLEERDDQQEQRVRERDLRMAEALPLV